MALLESECPQLLLLDSNATAINSLPLCENNGRGAVVALAAFDSLQAAVSALKEHGAGSAVDGAIPYPKLLLQSFGCSHATLPVASPLGVVGASPALKESVELARKAARSEASILLSGESGTGKELAARTIHSNSSRAARAFVPVDCASLPESLLEAELFGYEKGAFTGAVATKPGLMESADHGTLFFDEIGELAVSLQAKLLRALQEKEHRRVGGTHNIKFDVRVIAATNLDLQQRVKKGNFGKISFSASTSSPFGCLHFASAMETWHSLPITFWTSTPRRTRGYPRCSILKFSDFLRAVPGQATYANFRTWCGV
jgi:DNA-binding NtrC family response regulator